MFFDLGTSTMAGITEITTGLIGDLMPLIVVVLGLGIGLWILDHFIARN